MKTERTFRIVIVLLFFIVSAGFISEEIKDREASKVLDNYVTAIGGKKAVENIKNMVSKSQMEFVGADFILDREITETPTRYFIKVNSQRTGEITRTFDGTHCREKRMGEVRDITGEEKQSFLNTSAFLRYAEWEKNLTGYKYDGVEKVDGVKMHKLSVTTIYGQKETWYFDAKSNLLTQIEEELEMPGGKSTSTTVYSDYREVNGIKLSFLQTINMPGQTRKITFSEILANQEIDTTMFKLD